MASGHAYGEGYWGYDVRAGAPLVLATSCLAADDDEPVSGFFLTVGALAPPLSMRYAIRSKMTGSVTTRGRP